MSITLKPIISKADRRAFVLFTMDLYQGDPNWVPPIITNEMNVLSPNWNPVFQHGDVQLWLAQQDGRNVGRVAAIFNRQEAEFKGERIVRFGWFDFIDDEAVSGALIERVEQWAAERNAQRIIGPQGFTNLDKAGMLVEGFEGLGTLSTWYNYPYYERHITRLGYQMDLEWVEMEMQLDAQPPERQVRIAERVVERYGLKPVVFKNRKEVLNYTEDLFDLLEEAYKGLPTYIPITKAQIRTYAEQYLNYLKLDQITFIADPNGRLVSFGVVIPSLSKALQKSKGKMYPFGWWHLWRAMRKNDTAELVLIGVRDDFRNKGAYIPVFQHIYQAFRKMGVHRLRANPMLADNANVQGLFTLYNAHETRRRRTYYKVVGKD